MSLCFCGSLKSYQECCEAYHKGSPAPTANALMRSRYSAFCLGLGDYLAATHHVDYVKAGDYDGVETQKSQWRALVLLDIVEGSENDQQGEVEFIAFYQQAGVLQQLRERSQFIKQDGGWFYTKGKPLAAMTGTISAKIPRNNPCWCGSGKKFKRCHQQLLKAPVC